MMAESALKLGEVGFAGDDHVLPFQVEGLDVRGRAVQLGPMLDTILGRHNYPAPVARLLAEAITLTVLLGTSLKFEGKLIVQIKGDGPVDLLVADFAAPENVRAYARFDQGALDAAIAAGATEPHELLGKGILAFTIDQGAHTQRYQGIVPLEGASIGEAAEHYFEQSEQISSLIKIAARHDAEAGCLAGGLLLQHLPEGEVGRDRLHVRHDNPEWDHARTIAATLKDAELTDPATSLETLAWRLFHEDEVRVEPGAAVSRGCRCSTGYFAGVLAQFPVAERADMADDAGNIVVDCAFCSRIFPIPLDEISAGS